MKSISDFPQRSNTIIGSWMVACLFVLLVCGRVVAVEAADHEGLTVKRDIAYAHPADADAYAQEQCKLDVYLPKAHDQPFPLVVWFHGGALTGGAKTSSVSVEVAKSLASRGVGVILAGYRLSPKVKFPTYVTDAAQAVRWACDNAVSLKAQSRIFVGGHSAGGYLAALLAMDEQFLKDAGVGAERIAGFMPMSGEMMTHFTVAKERGNPSNVVTADDAAPIHHLRKDTPPILAMIGDNDWPARLEENKFFVAALEKVGKNPNVVLLVIKDRDHGGILKHTADANDPAALAILHFMQTGVLPAAAP